MRTQAIGSVAVFVASIVLIRAQGPRAPNPATDWPTYNHDLAATRFSPLAQITPENVAQLKQAWTYSMRPPTPPAGRGGPGAVPGAGLGGSQAVPLVVDGVLYLPVQN